MKIVQLELLWFRQHKKALFEFPNALVGIVGPNGSGKTTILEGITFALFGTRAIRGKLEDLTTRGAGKGETATVILQFIVNEDVYRLIRTPTSASLFLGASEEEVAVGTRDVNSSVETLIGMNYEEFSTAYLTEQKGLEFLRSRKGAAERERFILKLMGYDKIERAQEELRFSRSEKRGRLHGLESMVGDREKLETRKDAEQETLRHLEAQMNELVTAVTEAERKSDEARSAFNVQEKQFKEWQSKSEEKKLVETKQSIIHERQRSIQREISKLHPENHDPDKLEQQITLQREKLEEFSHTIAKLDQGWRDSIAIARAQHVQVSESLKTLERKLKELETLKDKKSKKKITDGDAKCPTCGQSLGEEHDKYLIHIKGEIEKSKKELDNLDQEIQKLLEEPQALRETRNANKVLQAEFQELQRSFEQLNRYISLTTDLKTHTDQILSMDSELAIINEKISALHFSSSEFESKKAISESAKQLYDVARMQRLKFEGEIKSASAHLERTRHELEMIDQRLDEVTQLRKELVTLEEADLTFTRFRKHLNATLRPQLTEIASEYITELTDGRYTTIEVGEDFAPAVIDDGEVKTVLSGGEEDIVHLCLRLALSHLLVERAGQAFSLLILDEVFGSFDEGRRSNVLNLLERLKGRFDQILIITHLDDIKEGVDYLIELSTEQRLEGAGDDIHYGELESDSEDLQIAGNEL